jgi:hypothetical protein
LSNPQKFLFKFSKPSPNKIFVIFFQVKLEPEESESSSHGSANTNIGESEENPSAAAAAPLDGLLAAGRLLAAAGFGTGPPPPPLPIKPEIDCSVPPVAVPKFEPAAATFITPGAYAAAALHATPRRRRRRNSGRCLVVFGFWSS